MAHGTRPPRRLYRTSPASVSVRPPLGNPKDIEDLLAEGYGKGQVARALGISKTTLYRRLNE